MPKVQTLFLCKLIMIFLGGRSTVAVLNIQSVSYSSQLVILAFSAFRLRQRFIMPRRGSSPTATSPRRTRRTSPIPTSPGPLFPSPTAPRTLKRSRFPSKLLRSLSAACISILDSGASNRTLHDSDESEADPSGRTRGSRDGTSGAGRSRGAGSTTKLSSEFFANLDDPVMQQFGSFMQQLQAKNDDLKKRLAASEEKARITRWYVITRSLVFLLSTTIAIKWLVFSRCCVAAHLRSVHSCLLRESRLGYRRT